MAFSSLSIAVTIAAPRDSASTPTAPDPQYKSSIERLLSDPNSDSNEEKSASRARSDVGLVVPIGEMRLRPLAIPAITLINVSPYMPHALLVAIYQLLT